MTAGRAASPAVDSGIRGQRRKISAAAFFAPLVVLLIDLLSNDGWQLASARLIDTLLGCGIALFIGYAP